MFRHLTLAFALSATMTLPVLAQDSKDKNLDIQSSLGDLHVGSDADAKKTGIPLYPGARLKTGKQDGDSDQANLSLFTEAFGFKLVVLKMESSDSPEKVAAFYQKALAKYGTVLNCSGASKAREDKDKSDTSKKLTCDDDHANAGEMLFKAGTKEKQHIVSVKPSGTGTVFNLLFIEARSDDKTPA